MKEERYCKSKQSKIKTGKNVNTNREHEEDPRIGGEHLFIEGWFLYPNLSQISVARNKAVTVFVLQLPNLNFIAVFVDILKGLSHKILITMLWCINYISPFDEC